MDKGRGSLLEVVESGRDSFETDELGGNNRFECVGWME